jgi:hypothetical protein
LANSKHHWASGFYRAATSYDKSGRIIGHLTMKWYTSKEKISSLLTNAIPLEYTLLCPQCMLQNYPVMLFPSKSVKHALHMKQPTSDSQNVPGYSKNLPVILQQTLMTF